jgi:hypothetical protein
VIEIFTSTLDLLAESKFSQKKLYQELEKFAVRVNALVDPIRVIIDSEVPTGSGISPEIFLDRNVAVQIEEHGVVILKGGYILSFTQHDVAEDLYVAKLIESSDQVSVLEKHSWLNADSHVVLIGENEVTNCIRDETIEDLVAIDWQEFFAAPFGEDTQDDQEGKQVVRIGSLPEALQISNGSTYVVLDDVGICLLVHREMQGIQGFLVVEEPQILKENDFDEAVEDNISTYEQEPIEKDLITSSSVQSHQATPAQADHAPMEEAIATPATPSTPPPTVNINTMKLQELEDFENFGKLSLFQRQQVKKRKEELEKQRRLQEFLHVHSPESMGEVVSEDLSYMSTDGSTGLQGSGNKRGNITGRFEEAKRKQQLQEEERLAKFKNDPRKKVTSQSAVRAIAGNFVTAEQDNSPQPPTESPQTTGGKTLGGARRSLRNMWEGVLETSKTTERDRYVNTKQNTISQFKVTQGTGLVRKRIDEWEELFVQIAASAEEMEEFLRAAHALSQKKEFSKKLSGLNLHDMISDFADACLIPEEIMLGDTRIYNIRLFAPVTQSYLKRMMQESKTNHSALPCGVYGEQSAKPPIDVFAAAIRTNDDKMYIAVTVKAATGKEDDPDVLGIRKIVIFGKDTKTQVMEKLFNIVHEYSVSATTPVLNRNDSSGIHREKSILSSMTIDEAEDEDDDYGEAANIQTGLLDDVHAMDLDSTPTVEKDHLSSQTRRSIGKDDSENIVVEEEEEKEEQNKEEIVQQLKSTDAEDAIAKDEEWDMKPEGDLLAGEDLVPDETSRQVTFADRGDAPVVEEGDQTNIESDPNTYNQQEYLEQGEEEEDATSVADEGDGTWTTKFTPMLDRSHPLDGALSVDPDALEDRFDSDAKFGSPQASKASFASSIKSFNSNDDNDDDGEPDAAILDDESPTHFAKELCLANVTIARTYLPSPIQRTEFNSSKFNKLKFSWPIEDETQDNLSKANHVVYNLNIRNVVTSTACSNVFVLDNLGHGADAYDRHCEVFTGTLRHATTNTHYSVTPRGDMIFEWIRGAAASGWLLKWPMQSQRLGRRRWRFFVLRDNLLAYYAGRPTSEEEIATTFSRNSLHITENSSVTIGRKFLQRCLVVTTPLDTLWIRVRKDYAVEVNRWMRELNQAITLQQRPKMVMSKTRVESRWYHESQNFFMVCVDGRGYRSGEQDQTNAGVGNKSYSVSDTLYHGFETHYLKAALFCLRQENATDAVDTSSPAVGSTNTVRKGSQHARRSITEAILGTGNKPTSSRPGTYNSNSIGSIDPSTVQYSLDIASSDGSRQQLPIVDERESPVLSCALTVIKLCGDVVLLGGAHGYLAVGRFTTLGLGSYTATAEESTGRLSRSPHANTKQNAHQSSQIPVGTRRVLMAHPFHQPLHSPGYDYPHAEDSVITAMGMGMATSLVVIADSRGLLSLWEVPSHYPHRTRSRHATGSSATPVTSPAGSSSGRPGLMKHKSKRQMRFEAIAAGEEINEDDYEDDENDEGEDDDEQYAMPLPATAKTLHTRQRPRLLATVVVSALDSQGYVSGDGDVTPDVGASSKHHKERITKLVFAQHDHHLYVCTSQRLLLITVDHNHQANRHLHHGHTQQRSLRASFRDWVVIDRALPDLEGIFDVVPPPAVSAQLFQEKIPVPQDALDSMLDVDASSVLEDGTPAKRKPALFDDDDIHAPIGANGDDSTTEGDWSLIEWRVLEYEGSPDDEVPSSGILRSFVGAALSGGGGGANQGMYAKRRCTVSRVEWSLEMFRAALRSLRPIRASVTKTISSNPVVPSSS